MGDGGSKHHVSRIRVGGHSSELLEDYEISVVLD